jgi:hypothetical protein
MIIIIIITILRGERLWPYVGASGQQWLPWSGARNRTARWAPSARQYLRGKTLAIPWGVRPTMAAVVQKTHLSESILVYKIYFVSSNNIK